MKCTPRHLGPCKKKEPSKRGNMSATELSTLIDTGIVKKKEEKCFENSGILLLVKHSPVKIASTVPKTIFFLS